MRFNTLYIYYILLYIIYIEQDNTSPTPNKNRKRNIIWFNPPFKANVTTKIGNKFEQILDKHFLKILRQEKMASLKPHCNCRVKEP